MACMLESLSIVINGEVCGSIKPSRGQVINYNKSVMCFSKNILWAEGDRLASFVGVRLVKCHERYLSLPSLDCRNKRHLFNGIKDRIWAKIKGWKGMVLSIGGKEVLLKAVIQAIPTYTMSLFKLPRLCNRFWWGGSEEKSKLHWCDWRRMCTTKVEGEANPKIKGFSIWQGLLWGRGIIEMGSHYWESNHWLPTLANLAKRGVPSDGYCPRCHCRPKLMSHALWGWRALFKVRENCLFLKGLELTDAMHFHDFMLICLKSLNFKDLELLCVIFWRVWFCRNQLIHNLSNSDLGDVVSWATHFLDEWRSIHKVDTTNLLRNVALNPKCRPPVEGSWKINTDAASCYRDRLISLGIIIRDVTGKLAMEAGLVPFQIETDSLQVVDLVSKGVPSSADVGSIIGEISGFLRSLPRCSICHIPRKGNAAAHTLAKMALSVDSDSCWVDACPPCVERIVQFDAPV
ncbi:hypothetical protein Dsin_028052 [Dipteronia sinensis]|uniref:RNase H type-1 domain-containing protein n=1 Tax=Dipteronia sinensis TaxID=43782 RepID=A0AAD9ZRB6_9ROSI|nr:hypothetical protein Dsin_028052 [Dipteronia sinensis]